MKCKWLHPGFELGSLSPFPTTNFYQYTAHNHNYKKSKTKNKTNQTIHFLSFVVHKEDIDIWYNHHSNKSHFLNVLCFLLNFCFAILPEVPVQVQQVFEQRRVTLNLNLQPKMFQKHSIDLNSMVFAHYGRVSIELCCRYFLAAHYWVRHCHP